MSGIAYDANFAATGFNYGNGVAATVSISPGRRQIQNIAYSNSGGSVFSETYNYASSGANDGHIMGITDAVDSGRNMTYTYDALERLTSAASQGSTNYPQWGLSWTYDRYGNRTLQTVTNGTGPSNSVTVSATTNQITTTGYAYDTNGNMTNDGENTLIYDAENRATSSADGSGTATYAYDASGSRVLRTFGGTTTAYIYSGGHVIAEYAAGSLSTEYIYANKALIAEHDSGTLIYHGRDHHSIRVNMDNSGNMIGQQGHFPYGEDWYMNNTTTKKHFTTYDRDSESGNDYAKARYHANRLGRFLTVDPARPSRLRPQLLNRYSYVASDPVRLADPTGRNPYFRTYIAEYPCDSLDLFLGCDYEDDPYPMPDGSEGGSTIERPGGGGCGTDSSAVGQGEGGACGQPPPPDLPQDLMLKTCTCKTKSKKAVLQAYWKNDTTGCGFKASDDSEDACFDATTSVSYGKDGTPFYTTCAVIEQADAECTHLLLPGFTTFSAKLPPTPQNSTGRRR